MPWTDTRAFAMIRTATEADLQAIVDIYNESIPSRLATADLEPVDVAHRRPWFRAHDENRPIWVMERDGCVHAWLSFQEFYGRAAYHLTAEVSVYVAQASRRQGVGRSLLLRAVRASPNFGLKNLLAFVFQHNQASLGLFRDCGFDIWGVLPRVADMDGVERDVSILGIRVGD